VKTIRGGKNVKSKSKWCGWSGRILVPIILALSCEYFEQPRTVAASQPSAGAVPQRHIQHQYSRPSLDDRVARFAKSLNLSEAQRSEVRKILEQRQQGVFRLRTAPLVTGNTAIDRFRALQVKTVEQIRAVLNDEQRKNYNPLAPRSIPQTAQPSVEDWLELAAPKKPQPGVASPVSENPGVQKHRLKIP
jgi:hypothetical protein